MTGVRLELDQGHIHLHAGGTLATFTRRVVEVLALVALLAARVVGVRALALALDARVRRA